MTLFGYGKTTQAIAERFGNCTVFDDAVTEQSVDAKGNILLPASEFDPQKSTLEITSPGIPPSHPLIRCARNLQSEYDLFADTMPRSVWISGSNGKTTATKMVQHLLPFAQAGGNVGLPLAQMDPTRTPWVLESSSFTLHYTRFAKPDIYLLLPITPDHLSWHGDMRAYEEAKLSPLKRMREGELALLPRRYEGIATDAFCVFYDSSDDIARYFGIDTNKVAYKGGFLQDALFALATQKVLYDRLDYDAINAFTLDPHRQEKLTDSRGRTWVNDSKATNVEAAIAAIETFKDRGLHLILGGEDKGADMAPLFAALPQTATIYAIGKNRKKLMELAKQHGITAFECEDLASAVKRCGEHLDTGGIALLSPAAASFDQFDSYEARGETFKTLVANL